MAAAGDGSGEYTQKEVDAAYRRGYEKGLEEGYEQGRDAGFRVSWDEGYTEAFEAVTSVVKEKIQELEWAIKDIE